MTDSNTDLDFTFDIDIEPEEVRCSDCKCLRPVSWFIGRRTPYCTCERCRFLATPPAQAPPFDDMVQLDELNLNPVSRRQELDIFMGDHLMQLTDMQIADKVVEAVERSDNYHYYVARLGDPMKRSVVNFAALCCQRKDIQRQNDNENERRRIRRRIDTYDCNGCIVGNIYREQQWINIKVIHQHHQPPVNRENNAVTDEVKDYIRANALTNSAPELYRRVCDLFGLGTTRAQVYHWRQVVSCHQQAHRNKKRSP